MSGLNSGNAANVVKTALDLVFNPEVEYMNSPALATSSDPMVFRQKNASNSAVISEQLQGPGYFQTKAEQQDVPGGTLRVGNQQTTTIVEYALGIDIPRTFDADDMHDTVEEAVREMKRNAVISQDKNAFATYRNAFTTQLTNDAVATFSNSHTTLNGVTVDNLETGTLTVANLESGIVSLLTQKKQDGVLGGYIARTLLVPSPLLRESTEILDSELQAGTANNNITWTSRRFPGLEPKFSPFLDAAQSGSDTAWFLLSAEHNICRFEREGLITVLVDWQNQANNNYRYKAMYREAYNTLTYQGAVASNGTV